ncbi:MAG: S41 family peptidase [Bryobacteraceae bacterium]
MRWLFLILATCDVTCRAQKPGAALLKADDLQADAAILRRAYETLHPGLYRYNTKAEMDLAFSTLNRQFDHDQTLPAAFLALSEFAAKVRCGHTQANPFNQSKEVRQALLQTPTRLPFYFKWLDRRMIVIRDFTPNRSLPSGAEILEIDGTPVSEILRKLMTIARADGANDAKRIAQLAVTGDSEYETFDLYHPMFFPVHRAQMDLVVRRAGESGNARVSVPPLTFEQRIAPIQERGRQAKGGTEVLFEWKYLSGNVAYLKMPTWALYNSKWEWKPWLDARVEEAAGRKAPALILDLRGNEGGNDVGNEILPHLIDQPITLSPMRRLVRYRKAPGDLLPYLDTWDKSFQDWGTSAVELQSRWPTAPDGVSYFQLTRYDDDAPGDVIKPAGRHFRGKVIVLIDATNSSATFQFAANIQMHHLGTLVGQTTGGSRRGINGGAFFFLRLPHSGIEMDLPLIGTFPPKPEPDSGVSPDVPVTETANDIANSLDPELAAALEIAAKP